VSVAGIIAVAAALGIGWHFSQALLAHRAIPGRRAQLGPLRRERARYLVRAALALAAFLVVLVAIAH
jgi:hypothetical protein